MRWSYSFVQLTATDASNLADGSIFAVLGQGAESQIYLKTATDSRGRGVHAISLSGPRAFHRASLGAGDLLFGALSYPGHDLRIELPHPPRTATRDAAAGMLAVNAESASIVCASGDPFNGVDYFKLSTLEDSNSPGRHSVLFETWRLLGRGEGGGWQTIISIGDWPSELPEAPADS